MVVVLPSLFDLSCYRAKPGLVLLTLFSLAVALSTSVSHAQREGLLTGQSLLVQFDGQSALDLTNALNRIEQLFMIEEDNSQYEPIVMVLHGPEVALFLRQNYQSNKHLIDTAARLTAFNVIDIRVCETQLEALGGVVGSLVPFVSTVPYGPSEIERLVSEESYVDF